VLHVAQPALSRQIKLLESELGIELVTRQSRGSLTAEGNLLLERSTFLIRFINQIKIDIVEHQASPRGPVILGLPPALENIVVPSLLARMRERYPDINLRIHESFSPNLCDVLVNGTVDFAVLSGPFVAQLSSTCRDYSTKKFARSSVSTTRACRRSPSPSHNCGAVPMVLTGVLAAGVRLTLDRAADLAGGWAERCRRG
jgi:LysR family nitrogen assimilation transcriptional regulator